jgi:TonB family protein
MILTMAMAAALAAQTGRAAPPRRAHGNLSQYFSTDDYPPNALARRAAGTVGFRLVIGADGAVTRCTITHSSNDAALDMATCAILLGRARYDPARDASGRAVRGEDSGRVTWRLPPVTHGMPFAPMRMVSRLSSNGAGGLSCSFSADGVAQPDPGPSRCGVLAGTGMEDLLRRAPAPGEVTLVSVAGPADAAIEVAGADEAVYGVLQYDLVSDLVIGRDGRVLGCRIVSRSASSRPVAFPPDPCRPPPPGASPMYEPSADPAPRRARYRFALYVKGWPADRRAPAPGTRP